LPSGGEPPRSAAPHFPILRLKANLLSLLWLSEVLPREFRPQPAPETIFQATVTHSPGLAASDWRLASPRAGHRPAVGTLEGDSGRGADTEIPVSASAAAGSQSGKESSCSGNRGERQDISPESPPPSQEAEILSGGFPIISDVRYYRNFLRVRHFWTVGETTTDFSSFSSHSRAPLWPRPAAVSMSARACSF